MKKELAAITVMIKHLNNEKERFLSRQKQIEIAKSRGTEHFGPQIKK